MQFYYVPRQEINKQKPTKYRLHFSGISGLNEAERKDSQVQDDILAGKREIHWPAALSQTAVEPLLATLLSGLGLGARDFCLGAGHPVPGSPYVRPS